MSGCRCQLFPGQVGGLRQNSRYFSAVDQTHLARNSTLSPLESMSQFVVEFQGHLTAAPRPLLQTNSRCSLNSRLALLLPNVPAGPAGRERAVFGLGSSGVWC